MCSLKTRNKEETERTSSMSCLCFSNRHTPEGHRRTGRDRGTGPPGGSATLTIYDEERHFRRPSTEVSQRFLFTGFPRTHLKNLQLSLMVPGGKSHFFHHSSTPPSPDSVSLRLTRPTGTYPGVTAPATPRTFHVPLQNHMDGRREQTNVGSEELRHDLKLRIGQRVKEVKHNGQSYYLKYLIEGQRTPFT